MNFFNPFDDVSAKEAIDTFINRDQSNVFQETARGANRAIDSATLGGLSNLDKNVNDRTPYYTSQRSFGEGGGTDMLTSGLGYLVPGLGTYKALNATRAGKGLTQFGSKGVGQRLTTEGIKGAATGGVLAGAEVGIRESLNPNDYSASDNLRHIGLGVGTGAIADPALYGLGKVAQRGLSRFIQGEVPTYTGRPSEDALSGLLPKTTSRYTPQTTQSLDRLSQSALRPPEFSGARTEIETPRVRENPFSESIDSYNRAIDEQYNYLKDSLANRRGVQQGGIIRDEMGDVVDRYGRISENPQWYQEFYSRNGKVPNNTELRQLAEQHVRDGFGDEFGEIPAWKPKEVEEIDNQIDELNGLLQSDPQQEPAIRPLIDALEQERNNIMTQFDEALYEPITPRNTEPQLKQQFEAISPSKEPELRRIPDVLFDSKKQSEGNAETFRSKVDRKPQKEENTFFSTLRTQFVDDVAPLETLEKKITGSVGSAEDSIYKQARLYKGSPAKAEQLVKEQIYPIIKDVQNKGYNLDDLGDYALAVHAKDVNEKGTNSGFTNAEIEDVIKKLGTPAMEEARKKLMGVNNYVLDMLSNGDKPVLSPESIQAMRDKYPNYMPLFRSFDDEKIEFASGLSNALSVGSSPIKKLKGSSRDVVDPIESVIKNIYKATNVVDRNNVASKLDKLSEKDIDGNFIRKLEKGEDTGRLNVISAMDNGQKVNYEVPPDVYKAMKNLDKESSNTLIKILAKPASTLRSGATLTPEFSMRNFLRDVPAAAIVSESGFNPFVDFPVGLWQSIWKGRTIKIGDKEFKTSGDLYEQFIKENGGYGNIMSMDREAHQKSLKKALTEANTQYIDVLDSKTYKALMKKFANPINTLRTLADISESGTKVGEFRAAKRKGASPQEAAYRARDIMDFGRAGVSIREANKVVAFLNANIQGKSKLWRAFSQNPAKVSGKAMAMVTIPTIGAVVAQEMFANEKQREVLKDAPRWLKDTFYLVPVPGTNQIARIPKPFDLAYPFSNSLERAFEFVAKNDKEAFDGFVKEGFSAMAVPTMLTGLAPIVEGMANYSFFRQGSIIPQREQNMEFPDQHDVNTSETAKFLGKGINALTGGEGSFKNFGSPRIVDNTIQGFTGGLGTYFTSVLDMFINGLSSEDQPEKPAKSIDQQPIAKAFLVNQSGSSKSLDKFYDMRDKLTKARGSANQDDKEFSSEAQYKKSNDLNKGISDLNKEIRTVQNSPTLSSQQKKEQLDKLIRERNKAANEAVNILKKME